VVVGAVIPRAVVGRASGVIAGAALGMAAAMEYMKIIDFMRGLPLRV
jgi:hypothetical protein